MENESLLGIVNSFFQNNTQRCFFIDYGEFMSLRKLKNAKRRYANYNKDKEIPLLLVDDTFFRSAKKGILLTNSYLYYRLYSKRGSSVIKKGKFPINKITNLYLNIGRMGSELVINNQKEAFTTAFGIDEPKKTEGEILNRLFDLIFKSLNLDE